MGGVYVLMRPVHNLEIICLSYRVKLGKLVLPLCLVLKSAMLVTGYMLWGSS